MPQGCRSGPGLRDPLLKEVLLLMDTSGSMAGDKILQAKNGASDFFKSASERGYSTGLAVFADRAAMVCDPTVENNAFEIKVAALRIGIVGGGTDLAAGLDLAGKFKTLTAVVVVTDGQPNSPKDALRAAAVLKQNGVEILCIGTDDADKPFSICWQHARTLPFTSRHRTSALRSDKPRSFC